MVASPGEHFRGSLRAMNVHFSLQPLQPDANVPSIRVLGDRFSVFLSCGVSLPDILLLKINCTLFILLVFLPHPTPPDCKGPKG